MLFGGLARSFHHDAAVAQHVGERVQEGVTKGNAELRRGAEFLLFVGEVEDDLGSSGVAFQDAGDRSDGVAVGEPEPERPGGGGRVFAVRRQGFDLVQQQLGVFLLADGQAAGEDDRGVGDEIGPHALQHLGKDQRFDRTRLVFQHGEAHQTAGFGRLLPDVGQHAAHADLPPVPAKAAVRLLQNGGEGLGVHGEAGEGIGILGERVPGDVKPGDALLQCVFGTRVVVRYVRQRRIHDGVVGIAEQRGLACDDAAARVHGPVHRSFVNLGELRAVGARAVEGAREDQRFHDALVDEIGGHAAAEVEDAPVVAAAPALFDDGIDGLLAAGLDRAEAEPDAGAAGGIRADRELAHGTVDVRRQQRDVVPAAVVAVGGHLAAVAADGVEHGGEELHRPVELQPGRPHGDDAVGRGVGLVERVGGESGHLVEDGGGHLCGDAPADGAGNGHHAVLRQAVDEDLPFLGHDVVLFLGHGAANEVAAAVGVAGQVPHDLHHLLLVNHAAVGDAEDGLQQRVLVVDGLRMVFAPDIARNRLHRAGPVEGYGRDDVLEILRLHGGKEGAHAAAFQLEDAVRLSFGDHGVYAGVVQRDVLRAHVASRLAHQVQRVADDGKGAQPQKVHLEQPEALDGAHRELGRDDVVVALQGDVIRNRPVGDEHAGSVRAGVPGEAFQRAADVDEPGDPRFLAVAPGQLR